MNVVKFADILWIPQLDLLMDVCKKAVLFWLIATITKIYW